MCGLSTAQIAFAPAKLKELYKSKQGYVKSVETRLTALEKSGWSLPLYREVILGDATKVSFEDGPRTKDEGQRTKDRRATPATFPSALSATYRAASCRPTSRRPLQSAPACSAP